MVVDASTLDLLAGFKTVTGRQHRAGQALQFIVARAILFEFAFPGDRSGTVVIKYEAQQAPLDVVDLIGIEGCAPVPAERLVGRSRHDPRDDVRAGDGYSDYVS